MIGLVSMSVMQAQTKAKSIYFKLKKEYYDKEIKGAERSAKSIQYGLLSEKDDISNYPFLKAIVGDKRAELTRPSYYGSVNDLKSIFKLTFTNSNDMQLVFKQFKDLDQVIYYEKEPIYPISYTPNDELYSQSSNSWYHDMINSSSAWDYQLGSSNIKVAIIDNAIYLEHDDLSGDIGYDFAEDDPSSTPPYTGFIWSHGTHCAGLATMNHNNIGMPSLGGAAKVMGAKCAPDNDMGNVTNTYEAIQWACENGARVVSMSYAGTDYSNSLQNLFNSYSNVVFVAAAGNDSQGSIRYPGGYDNVLCVGSVDQDDEISSFSNYNGNGNWVDVCAPGGYSNGGLLSTMADNGYDKMGGTSMSTPLTAGLCAMLLAQNPALTGEEVRNCIISSGDPSNESMGPRINALASVLCVSQGNILTPDFVANSTLSDVMTIIDFTDLSSSFGENIVAWDWYFEGGTPSTSTAQNPSIMYENEGVFDCSLTVTNAVGETQTVTFEDYITISQCKETIVHITPDNYGSEITWDIKDNNDNIIQNGGPYNNNASEDIIESICLAYNSETQTCYTFTIYDAYGDGICCQYGDGTYIVYNPQSQEEYAIWSDYDDSQSTTFCLGGNITGISDQEPQNILVYPNPTEGIIYISTKDQDAIELVEIHDVMGKLLLSTTDLQINLSELNPGSYFIQINTSTETVVQTIILL